MLVVAIWVVALLLAASLDARVAQYMQDSGIASYVRSNKLLHSIMKAPGEYWFTVVVMVGVYFLHPRRWRASLLVFMATCLSGVNGLLKWVVGRFRPFKGLDENSAPLTPFTFHPFPHGLAGLTGVPNLSLPSGHAALAFATAASASILLPRGRWIFYGLACMVGAERVLENAHWLSDVVAAAALGIGGVWIVHRLFWQTLRGNDRHGCTIPVAGDPGVQRAGEHSHPVNPG
jgi:membrane-associated phospholipid phosphatase